MKKGGLEASVSSPIYVILVLVVIVFFWITSNQITTVYTDVDITRDFIKTMVQAQYTVIVIVISLSLAAIQLATSTYSVRLFRSFEKNFLTWLMIGLYAGSITFDLWLLGKLVDTTEGFQPSINFSFLLSILALALLLPYYYNMINILSPESIIKSLAKDIKTSVKFEEQDWREKDPLQPIDDLICSSVTKHDYKTAKIGLDEMTKYVAEIVQSSSMEKFVRGPSGKKTMRVVIESIVDHYCTHMERLGKLLVKYDEDKLVLQIVADLRGLGLQLAHKEIGDGCVLLALEIIGTASVEKRMEEVAENTIEAIGDIGTVVHYEAYHSSTGAQDPNEAHEVAQVLQNVGLKATDSLGFNLMLTAVKALGKVGLVFANNRYNLATGSVASSLHLIAVLGLSQATYTVHIHDALFNFYVTKTLVTLGNLSHENGLGDGFEQSACGLWEVGLWAVLRELPKTVAETAKGLAELTVLNSDLVQEGLKRLKLWEKELESEPHYPIFMWRYLEELEATLNARDRERKKGEAPSSK